MTALFTSPPCFFPDTLDLIGLKKSWTSEGAVSHLYYLFDLFLAVLTKCDAVGDKMQLEKPTNSFGAYRSFLRIISFYSLCAFCVRCSKLA